MSILEMVHSVSLCTSFQYMIARPGGNNKIDYTDLISQFD